MASKYLLLVFGIVLLSTRTVSAETKDDVLTYKNCFDKDSISCVQGLVYRQIRDFFSRDSVQLFGGLSLVRDKELETGRAASSDLSDAEVENGLPKDVEQREMAIESYAFDKVVQFFQGRSVNFNLPITGVSTAARALVANLPKELTSTLIEEGRGKKLMKHLLPLLLAVKVKLGVLIPIALVAVAVIAKKAILASLLSLLISIIIGLKKLVASKHHGWEPHHVSHGYSSAGSSYGGDTSGYGEHGAYSQQVSHTLAYGGQKPKSRTGDGSYSASANSQNTWKYPRSF